MASPSPSSPPSPPAILERWSAAASRLGLDEAACAAGALLLAAEIDPETHHRIAGDDAAMVAPRRADLLRALAAAIGDDRAASGLAALEERGVATPLASYAGPWLKAELELDRRVRAHCLGTASPQQTPASAEPHPLPRVEKALADAAARSAREPGRFLVVVRGRAGGGRDLALRRLLAALGVPALRRTPYELRQRADPFEPELSGSATVWDPRRTDPGPDDYDIARRWLARSASVAVVLLDRHHDAPEAEGRVFIAIDVDPADAAERRQGWGAALARTTAPPEIAAAAAADLARRSRAGAGIAARTALMLGDAGAWSKAELIAAAERELAALVRPSTMRGILVEHPSIPIARIVASADVYRALRTTTLLARLAASLPRSERVGVKALFSGPSGTGKTMAARALATELGRPLYRVDLASVVSKWVGETEKNLREALSAAESAGAVLLFDEGDALFGKRGDVSHGADRYANTEVAYLLQAVEAYDGIAIVTTNARSNVDAAFERRFDACIEFHPPGPVEREAIWRQELGEAAQGLPAATIEDVARRVDLHGGSIAAAARVARVLALDGGRAEVSDADLREAVRGELLKTRRK
jgi:hypothetical protein